MKNAPIPSNEKARLCAVFDLKILDTAFEKRFDDITKEATKKFRVPISTITIIDKDREWYKSVQGLNIREGNRNVSFCGHALLQEEILIIEDTRNNPDFANNPMVIRLENPIRFYAGKSIYDRATNLQSASSV